MSSDPIKLVLFSVDETLFDWQHAFNGGLQQVMRHVPSLGPLKSEDVFSRYFSHVFDMNTMQRETISRSLTRFDVGVFLGALNVALPAGWTRDQCEAIFMNGYKRKKRTVAHAQEALRALKSEGFMVAVLTRHLDPYDVLRDVGYFNDKAIDAVFCHIPEHGQEIEAEAFRRIAAQTGTDPWNMLVAGQPHEHAEGALGALCKFIAVDRAGQSDQFYWEDRVGFRAIRDLRDLGELLKHPDLINWRVSVEDDTGFAEESTISSTGTEIVQPNTPEPPAWSPITLPPEDQENPQPKTPEQQVWKPITPDTGTIRLDGRTLLDGPENIQPGSPKPPVWGPTTPEPGHSYPKCFNEWASFDGCP